MYLMMTGEQQYIKKRTREWTSGDVAGFAVLLGLIVFVTLFVRFLHRDRQRNTAHRLRQRYATTAALRLFERESKAALPDPEAGAPRESKKPGNVKPEVEPAALPATLTAAEFRALPVEVQTRLLRNVRAPQK